MASRVDSDARYNASPKGRARSKKYQASASGAARQREAWRKCYYSGGRHQQSIRRAQNSIDKMLAEHPELEAIANGG